MTNTRVVKWQGIKNNETKQVTNGYLWIEFLENMILINTKPNIVKHEFKFYEKGKKHGFGIRAKNRREAITEFHKFYKVL